MPPPTPKPGQSLSAQDVEALEQAAQVEAVEEAEDIDLDQWLAQQTQESTHTDYVVFETNGHKQRLKIAVVTEGEENRLLRGSRKPDPRNPKEQKVDPLIYRRAYVAFSVLKAQLGRAPDDLELVSRRDAMMPIAPGTITKLQNAIQKLSQYEQPERQTPDPFAFLT